MDLIGFKPLNKNKIRSDVHERNDMGNWSAGGLNVYLKELEDYLKDLTEKDNEYESILGEIKRVRAQLSRKEKSELTRNTKEQ